MPCDSGPGVADLWAMAAELERQFAGYKQRLAERTGGATTVRDDDEDDDDDSGGGGAGDDGAEEGDDEPGGACRGGGGGGGDEDEDVTRGRMYEAYVRRRDERLREGWRARMERKEAEVKALWAQLELTAGRAGAGAERTPAAAGDPTVTEDDRAPPAGDGDGERKTDGNDGGGGGRRSSPDAALAPRRITGKKHARTRSFSSSIVTSSNCADVGRRRAMSQEPPPSSEPDASISTSREAKKESRVWPAGAGPGAAATTTTATTTRPKSSLRRKNSSVKGHHSSSAKPAAGPKLPRSLPRRASSAGPEGPGRGVAPVVVQPSRSAEYDDVPAGTPGASPPRIRLVVRDGSSGGTGAANARATSPEPDRGAVDEAVPHGEPEAKDAGVERHGEEKVDAHGEITSDSEPEPSYVYVNKDSADGQAMTLPEPLKLSGSDAALDSDVKGSEENAEEMPAAAPAQVTAAAEIASTTNAEEAPARESSDESSLSVRSGPSARASCSSRDQSIERLLEADAALLRKKREERAEKRTPRTPGSAGSRFSGTARSPRETTVRGFKKFLSFGKKNRGREVTVIDCTSPSVPSPADDDSASGRWQSAGSMKPRMGSSDAASDDTDHGFPVSPQAACSLQSLVAASPAKSELAEIVPQEKSPKVLSDFVVPVHRSFFSFRSLNCGRG